MRWEGISIRQLRFASVGCLRQAGWLVSGEELNKDSWGLTGVIMSILSKKTRLFFVGDAGVDSDGGVFAVLVICFRGLFGLEMVAGWDEVTVVRGPHPAYWTDHVLPSKNVQREGRTSLLLLPYAPLHQPLYFII